MVEKDGQRQKKLSAVFSSKVHLLRRHVVLYAWIHLAKLDTARYYDIGYYTHYLTKYHSHKLNIGYHTTDTMDYKGI